MDLVSTQVSKSAQDDFEISASEMSPRRSGLIGLVARWAPVLRSYLIGQSLIQFLNAIIGICVIRWMTVEQYAYYTLANAFQSSAQQFVEFGLSGAVVALLGKDIADKQRLGRLISAGTQFRRKMLWIVGGICAVLFPLWFTSKGWPLGTGLYLTLSILGFLIISGMQAYYRPPLIVHKELGLLYKLDIASSLVRFLALAGANALHLLNSQVAATANILAAWLNGIRVKKASAKYVELPSIPADDERREMLRYVRPIMPIIIFNAVQAQIAVMVVGHFGGVGTLAEVGALGRLSVLFSFFSAANGMLIKPFIARQSRDSLLARYLMVLMVGTLLAGTIFAIACLFPEPLLWVLGPNYTDAHAAFTLMIANASLNYLNGVLVTLNSARKWIFWWIPTIMIPGIVFSYVAGVFLFDVSTSSGAFAMSLLATGFITVLRLVVSLVGLRFRPEESATYCKP